jgi:hypothetical protein
MVEYFLLDKHKLQTIMMDHKIWLCTPCLINTNYNKDSASSVYFLEENCRHVLNFTVLTSDFLISEHYALVALHFIREVPILNEHRFFKYVFGANGVQLRMKTEQKYPEPNRIVFYI